MLFVQVLRFRHSALLFYHISFRLSSVFFRNLFKFRLKTLGPRSAVPDSFDRLPCLPSFVKPFFRILFQFSISFAWHTAVLRDSFVRLPRLPPSCQLLFSLFLLFLYNDGKALKKRCDLYASCILKMPLCKSTRLCYTVHQYSRTVLPYANPRKKRRRSFLSC